MTKKIIGAILSVCFFMIVCIVPSSAQGERGFRVAVVIDSSDIKGFSQESGTLREFLKILKKHEDASVTFYYEAADTALDGDLAASLMYFKVNGFRVGIYGADDLAVANFNDIIKYMTKSKTRLVICEDSRAKILSEYGYSVMEKADITLSAEQKDSIYANKDTDTTVKLVLCEDTLYDIERLAEYAYKNYIYVYGTDEGTR